MLKKLIEIFLVFSTITLCFYSYTYMSSVNVESFSQQKAKNLFDKTSKVKSILDVPDKDNKLVINDYESKVAIRDIKSIEEDVASLSISYEKISKLHSGKTKLMFYFSITTCMLASFLVLANKFDTPRIEKSIKKNKKKLSSEVSNNTDDAENIVKAELEGEQIVVGENPTDNRVENFLTNSFISTGFDDYELTKTGSSSDDSISYSIESNNGESLEVEYDLIEGFLSDLSYNCSNVIPSIEISRDVDSLKLNFSIDFETNNKAGEEINV